MTRKTALNALHRQLGGRLVDFAGWELPLHFGSQLEEHLSVRRHAGAFDISHMTVLDLEGSLCLRLLRTLLANDAARLKPGQALYSCMLNDQGGIVDDLLVYFRGEDRYRIVANGATRDKVTAWLQQHAHGTDVTVRLREDLSMVSVQGPEARALLRDRLPVSLRAPGGILKPFEFTEDEASDWLVACGGYTGEDGFEILLPHAAAAPLWLTLVEAGVQPCGLGARDTLRLEAGLRLYGVDMDETVTPLESALEWTVAWEPQDRRFLGREALERQRAEGPLRRFVGVVLEEKGVLRSQQRVVVPNVGEGVVTSGGYSPIRAEAIGFARLPPGRYDSCCIDIRGHLKRARITSTRFLRQEMPSARQIPKKI